MIKNFVLLVLLIVNLSYSKPYSDSTNNCSFSILISTKPMLNWIKKIDSNSNFLNSNSLIECQYKYKNNIIGLGINFLKNKQTFQLNNVPVEQFKISYNLNPFYEYHIYSKKRISINIGLGYIVNYNKTEKTIFSNIEKINYLNEYIENGANLFSRFNFKLNKKFSLESEFGLYFLNSNTTYRETFPLSPSLSVSQFSTNHKTYFSIPFNLFIKYQI